MTEISVSPSMCPVLGDADEKKAVTLFALPVLTSFPKKTPSHYKPAFKLD